MGVVDHQRGVVLLAELHQPRDRSDVAFHRIDAVHHDEFRRARLRDLQFLFKFIHIVVGELEYAAEGKPAAVDDAGVVERIEEDVTVAEAQAGDDAQVHLETGAVGHGFLLADQFGEFIFKGQVDVERSVEETRAGAAGPVFADGLDGGLFETGVVGQSQIRIRTKHQHILPAHFHHRILPGFNGTVIGIDAKGFDFVSQGIFGANLVEKTVVHFKYHSINLRRYGKKYIFVKQTSHDHALQTCIIPFTHSCFPAAFRLQRRIQDNQKPLYRLVARPCLRQFRIRFLRRHLGRRPRQARQHRSHVQA